jgi:hypothetical protein
LAGTLVIVAAIRLRQITPNDWLLGASGGAATERLQRGKERQEDEQTA